MHSDIIKHCQEDTNLTHESDVYWSCECGVFLSLSLLGRKSSSLHFDIFAIPVTADLSERDINQNFLIID